VSEQSGLLLYRGEGRELLETELSDDLSFNQPAERLRNGQVDPTEVFDLRLAALHHQHRRRQSKVRGFVGGRIHLIPHQLYIAPEVAGRLVPRVLLADEVGLGKTIEACLIVHRLIQTGRAQRTLILVPEPLIHQWFVELLRRFNLWFHIFDEQRCQAIEGANPEENPFLDDQLVLCGIQLFAGNERRVQQALTAEWDMLVVDEAHHLGWSPTSVSPEYALVEALGRKIPGLLLLTATPEQLGMASHFARLRLLDPDRYYDLAEFIREAEEYRDVAGIAERLLSRQPFRAADMGILAGILAQDEAAVRAKLEQLEQGETAVREELIDELLDRHGTGRVMFRNTRATMTGFPKRTAQVRPLVPLAGISELFDHLAEEFAADTDENAVATFEPDFSGDPRIVWLADLLRNLAPAKVLLICRTQRKAEAIDTALRQRINVKAALFHEGLPLVQRDRNAAWFAEEEGARLLICSEIGSEGRNFQFAHHLVLFDLPLDPELLEQRIGRLDRIGQTAEIRVHVPFTSGSSQEVLVRWYHEGLNAFEKNLRGGHALLERFGSRLHDLARDFHETQDPARADLDLLIRETRAAGQELAVRLERGRDRLLELNSYRPEAVAKLIREIRQQDEDQSLDSFMLAVLDHYAIHVEELAHRTYQLGSAGVFADSFPGVPAEGLTLTCDRQRALSREDIQFLTWDHPLVTGALDLLLGSEQGNSSFALWPDTETPGLYLEAIFLLECIASPHLHLDRFLPPTPLRVLLDYRGHDAGASWSVETLNRNLKNGNAYPLLDQPGLREDLLPSLLEKAEAIAQNQGPSIVAQARKEMNAQLGREISRMKELQKVNRQVRAEEIELLVEQQRSLDEHLISARLRLDAVRLIRRGP
jgi:ATP-dependent helicase HepA